MRRYRIKKNQKRLTTPEGVENRTWYTIQERCALILWFTIFDSARTQGVWGYQLEFDTLDDARDYLKKLEAE